MSAYPSSFDHMLAAWNERDLSRIRGFLEAALTPDVTFVDPTIETHGLAEFEENVRAFRAKYPKAALRRASDIDSHHNLSRYSWEILIDEKVVLLGFDVVETADDGRVRRVLGFFGPLPRLTP